MTIILQFLLEITAFLLLLPVSILLVEITLAVTKIKYLVPQGERLRLAVLMPAHNEASVIAGTIRSIIPQLSEVDRLLVVADNCADNTASVASAEGGQVVARTDLARRGKGYALDFGIRHLELDPPDVVIVIDADCRVAPGSIDRLARLCASTGRPIQALYLMYSKKNASLRLRVGEFAWIVRNRVRPEGLYRLGLPCQLMGTGMAFPWLCIRKAKLATSHIVEDLKLGIDLAHAGTPPLFCPDALVTSEFPTSIEAIRAQRTRWEHGHLSVIVGELPRLFLNSLAQRNFKLMALTLDLSVPPLALLTLLVAAVWCATIIFFIFTDAIAPVGIATTCAALLGISVFMSWLRYGRQVISLSDLALALVYALWKIPLYAKFLVARQVKWIRSERDDDGS